MSRMAAWFLHLGLSFSIAGLFVPSNFIKLASLASCAIFAFGPGRLRSESRRFRLEILLWIPVALGATRILLHGPADGFRDLAYFLIPPVFFAVGRRLQAEGVDVQALVFRYSRIYCLVFLAGVAYQWLSRGSIDVTTVRDFVSPGSFLLVYCLFLLVRGRESSGALLRTPTFLLASLVFVAQASRTYSLALVALLLTPREFQMSGKAIAQAVGAVAAVVAVVALVGGAGAGTDLAVKWIDELAFQDAWTMDDLGSRYRAYESFAAYTSFASLAPLQKAFGAGFGSMIDLGVPVVLAGTEYDAVPWIHNGYLYVLVKVGLVGMAAYLLFLAKVYAASYPDSSTLGPALARGTVVGLLLANIVICGWFNIESVFAYLVLGYMIAIRTTGAHPAEADPDEGKYGPRPSQRALAEGSPT